jgi:purine-binding chemotaxis protein CheW
VPDPRDAGAASTRTAVFLTIRVGDRRYALPAGLVHEIVHVPSMTRVPQSPPALLGIANLRGTVLPVASLRRLLAMTDAPQPPGARAVVLDVGSPVAVVVDAVDALVTVESERIQTGQTELAVEPGERVDGAFETGTTGQVAKVLDVRGLLDAAFKQRSATAASPRRAASVATAANDATVATRTEDLVTFDVAGQEFALDLAAVDEIVQMPATRGAVPRADALVLGITSLRGALLPLLSLRGLLGLPSGGGSAREKVVVMRVAGATVGLVADRAVAVVAADPALVDAVPPVIAARMGGESQLRGIYRGDDGRRLISILAPEQLFREDVIRRLGDTLEESGMRTTEGPTTGGDERFVVVFRLGPDEYALPIDAVEEIAHVPEQIRRVPRTPRFLEGVVSFRGSVLPVIDQRRRFDMPPAEHLKSRRLVVIRTDRHRAGLIVDAVADVLRITEDAVQPAPALTDDISRLVRGVINLEQSGRIVLLLDSAELLTRAERGLLDKWQAESGQARA